MAQVVPAVTIGDPQLVSSSVAEPDVGEVAWNPATAYEAGNRAYLPATHVMYERLLDGTTTTSPDQDATNWTPVGQTNQRQMFDLLRNTGTTGSSPMVVVLAPGQRINSVAGVGLNAEQAVVEMKVGGVVVYSATINLNNRNVVTWYDYFFDEFSTKPDFLLTDLPPYSGAQITVTFTSSTGVVTCGGLLVGTFVYLGDTTHDAVSDVRNFSTIDRDAFGNSILIPRRNVPKINLTTICDRSAVNKLIALRDMLNAVPALWSWLDDQDDDYFDAGIKLGIYTQFVIALDQPDSATVTLVIEEV